MFLQLNEKLGMSVFSLTSLTERLRPRPTWHASSTPQKKKTCLQPYLLCVCVFSLCFLSVSSLCVFCLCFLSLFSLSLSLSPCFSRVSYKASPFTALPKKRYIFKYKRWNYRRPVFLIRLRLLPHNQKRYISKYRCWYHFVVVRDWLIRCYIRH